MEPFRPYLMIFLRFTVTEELFDTTFCAEVGIRLAATKTKEP